MTKIDLANFIAFTFHVTILFNLSISFLIEFEL